MNSMNRRKFLFGGFEKTDKSRVVEPIENPEIVIGKIIDFPIGEEKVLTSIELIVESFPEGIRVRAIGNDKLFFAIKINQIGELIINRARVWPAARVFSIITNEPTYLNTSWENCS